MFTSCTGNENLNNVVEESSAISNLEDLNSENSSENLESIQILESTEENDTISFSKNSEIPSSTSTESTSSSKISPSEENSSVQINVNVGGQLFTATLEDNVATKEFVKMMENAPVSIDMSDYSGFEKVGSLGKTLPSNNQQMTTQSGDIVLYNGNQIVVFYGSNSWSYTKIGRIDNLAGWEKALGSGNVTLIFSLQ